MHWKKQQRSGPVRAVAATRKRCLSVGRPPGVFVFRTAGGGTGGGGGVAAQWQIDSASFEPRPYVRHLLRTAPLAALLDRSDTLCHEVKALDSDMQVQATALCSFPFTARRPAALASLPPPLPPPPLRPPTRPGECAARALAGLGRGRFLGRRPLPPALLDETWLEEQQLILLALFLLFGPMTFLLPTQPRCVFMFS